MSTRDRKREVEEVRETILDDSEDRVEIELISDKVIKKEKLVSTSSTMLNLALSDNSEGGFYLGTIVNIIGDSAAGKTFLLWSIFAEMCHDSRFDEHDITYDEPEASLEFNIPTLFGDETSNRVELAASESVEAWHDSVLDKANEGVPFIEGLDSLDAICDEDEIERDIRKGTFGGKKPKLMSEILRKIVQKVKGSNSMVFIISQTRDNIGITFGSKKTRSGGRALKFFASHEIWLAIKGHIKRKDRDVGVEVVVKVGKNKLTGKLRQVEFPIYYDYGVDDTVSCIRFLITEGVFTRKKGGEITSPFINAKEDDLANYIESNNLKGELVQMVTDKWREIEDSIKTNRIPKYAGR